MPLAAASKIAAEYNGVAEQSISVRDDTNYSHRPLTTSQGDVVDAAGFDVDGLVHNHRPKVAAVFRR